MVLAEVNFNPFTVMDWPALKLKKVSTVDSVTVPLPSVVTAVGVREVWMMDVTSPLLSEVAVAVTVAPEALLPVVNPAVNVPAKEPKAALAVLFDVTAAAVMPEDKLAKAAATWIADVAPVDVNVKPFAVTDCPAVNELNVRTVDSAVAAAAAAADAMPVTPNGSVDVDVFMPRPKSEPLTAELSYQTDRLRPSVVVSVMPPLPASPALTPWVSVLALMLSITY